MAQRLPRSFYLHDDVVAASRELLGKKLVTCFNDHRTSGIIVETEAYAGAIDRASHAYGSRRTARTEVMFGPGGVAYVYLCYGMYHLFNVVFSAKDRPHAILVRAIEPLEGIETMERRSPKIKKRHEFGNGPGKLTRALGIHTAHTGLSLIRNSPIWIEAGGIEVKDTDIIAATRVGVEYAKEDALLPYRFYLKDNRCVSKGKGL